MDNDKKTQEFLEGLFKQGPALRIITQALTSTIKSYTKTAVVPGKPFLRDETNAREVAVAGLIRFEGNDFSLEMFLGFSRDLFLNLYENMFQSSEKEITPENQDLAGEILNIAFGAMDPEFRKIGFSFRSSFPIVYSGAKLEKVLERVKSTAIVIPYSCASKSFVVEIYAMDSLQEKWAFDPKKSA